jgi:hypothetical protein
LKEPQRIWWNTWEIDYRTWRLVLRSLQFQKDGRLTTNSQQRRARFITRSLIVCGLIKLPPLIRFLLSWEQTLANILKESATIVPCGFPVKVHTKVFFLIQQYDVQPTQSNKSADLSISTREPDDLSFVFIDYYAPARRRSELKVKLKCSWCLTENVGRRSSVAIATRYGLDGPGIESRWGASFSAAVQTGPGSHPASIIGNGSFFQGVKRMGGVVSTTYTPPSAKVKEIAELHPYSPPGLHGLF